jgi:hypothetical protein
MLVIIQKGNPSSHSSESIWKYQSTESDLLEKHILVDEEGKHTRILVDLVVSHSR